MSITRRSFALLSLGAPAFRAAGQQGVATGEVKPQVAPPPSGRPFYARFENIAENAGLRDSLVYGEAERRSTSSNS